MKKILKMDNRFFISILIVILLLLIINTSCQKDKTPPVYDTFTDSRDGEIYKYVKIGNQLWMSENLRFKPDSGNYWAYNYDTIVNPYGYLYDWETANNVCPNGWHLPSNAEWTELANNLGGFSVAGGKMKTPGTSWNPPNEDATNSSGFSALPCGTYEGNGIFFGRGNSTHFWSSEVRLNIWWLSTVDGSLHHTFIDMHHESASVRCVMD